MSTDCLLSSYLFRLRYVPPDKRLRCEVNVFDVEVWNVMNDDTAVHGDGRPVSVVVAQ